MNFGDKFSGTCETPARSNIFNVGESEFLDVKEKEFFHPFVAKLLYLSNRNFVLNKESSIA